jgi:hypothetical protein
MTATTSPDAAKAAFDEWMAEHEAKRRELEHFAGNTRSYYHELLAAHKAALAAGKPGIVPDIALDFMQRFERPMKNRGDEWAQRMAYLDAQERVTQGYKRLDALLGRPGAVEALEALVVRELGEAKRGKAA